MSYKAPSESEWSATTAKQAGALLRPLMAEVERLSGNPTGGSLINVTTSGTSPTPSSVSAVAAVLLGERNAGTSTITRNGTSLEPGAWAIWAWIDQTWSLLNASEGATPPEPDTTFPTAGTLTAYTAATEAELSVTGALDDRGLHALPYAFSKDGGATWTAWQESPGYIYTGLTSATSYTFRHKVRDSSGNEKSGASVTKSTTVVKTWTVVASDDFTGAADGPLHGRTLPVGGLAWGSEAKPTQIVSEKATTTGTAESSAGVSLGRTITDDRETRVSADYYLGADVTSSNALQSIRLNLTMGGVTYGAILAPNRGTGTIGTTLVPQSGRVMLHWIPATRTRVIYLDGVEAARGVPDATSFKNVTGFTFQILPGNGNITGMTLDNIVYEELL